jgi:hypothetical protein
VTEAAGINGIRTEVSGAVEGKLADSLAHSIPTERSLPARPRRRPYAVKDRWPPIRVAWAKGLHRAMLVSDKLKAGTVALRRSPNARSSFRALRRAVKFVA